jgi:ribonuclease D
MHLIETISELEQLGRELQGESLVAADTEAAGYHRYRDRLCLLQLSTRDRTWIVDTMALGSLNPIADAFEEPGVEMVFHDADYDLGSWTATSVSRCAGCSTRRSRRASWARSPSAWPPAGGGAGRLAGEEAPAGGLGEAPPEPELLEYAAMDTRYLPQLRDLFRERLQELGRFHWAEEEFRIQERTRWTLPEEDGTGYLRLKGARDLTGRSLAALRELVAWREGVRRSATWHRSGS